MKDYDHDHFRKFEMSEIKIAVLGIGAVGKSAISIRFLHDTFVSVYDPTIESVYTKAVTVDDVAYNLDIIDTAGMEDLDGLNQAIFRQRDAFLLIYSVDDRASFDEIPRFHDHIIRCQGGNKPPCIICANKSDLPQPHEILASEGQDLAKKLDSVFFETSALTKQNVVEAFYEAVRQVAKTRKPTKKIGRKLCNLI